MFNLFKKWKVMVKNETSIKVKKLWSSNGEEYEDYEFKMFCYENGIKLEKTMPRTPQQNGIAKWMSKTLTKRIKSMCIQVELPKQF